jgi:cytochrome c oxidase cbb3-type subunit 3
MLEQHEHKHPVHNFDGIIENRVKSPPIYFSVLFYGLIVWGVVFSAYFLLSGWSSDKEFTQEMAAHKEQVAQAKPPTHSQGAPAAAAAVQDREAAGKEVFAQYCAACHGAAGQGGIGSDLTASDYRYGRTLEAIKASIGGGRPGGMPAFGNQLSSEEIESLARFVQGLR